LSGGYYFYSTELQSNISYGEEGGTVERFIPFTRSEALSDKLYFSGSPLGNYQFKAYPLESRSVVGLFPANEGAVHLYYLDHSNSNRLMRRTLTGNSLVPTGDDFTILSDANLQRVAMERDATSGRLYAFLQFQNNPSRLVELDPQSGQPLQETVWQKPADLDWSRAFIGVTADRLFIGANTVLPEKPTLLDVQHIVLFPFSHATEPLDGRYEIDSQSYHLKAPCIMQTLPTKRYFLACGGRENIPPQDYVKGDELFGFQLSAETLEPQEITQLTYNKGHDFTITDAQLTSRQLLFTSQNFTNNYPQTTDETFGFPDGTGNIVLRIFAPTYFALGATYNATDLEPDFSSAVKGMTDSYIYFNEATNVIAEAHQYSDQGGAYIVVTTNQLIPNESMLKTIERNLKGE
jgi:hypothetical protein